MAQSRSFDLDDLFAYVDNPSDGIYILSGKEETRK